MKSTKKGGRVTGKATGRVGGRSPDPAKKSRTVKKKTSDGGRTKKIGDCFLAPVSSSRGIGFGVAAAVVEAGEKGWDVAQALNDRTAKSGRGDKARSEAVVRLGALASKDRVEAASTACAALGHPKRLAVLARLFEGPATYRELQQTTGLGAGPLYHHVNQLRLASLLLPKRRDTYEMTRGGRNALLLALASVPLVKDTRARRAIG